jgi:uncharacterized protein (TIGR04552 family)
MNPSIQPKPLDALGLFDVESLRLILLGSSVIDWLHLALTDRREVDRLLQVCGFAPDTPSDQAWMRAVLGDAVKYLQDSFHYRIPREVAEPNEIHDLFMFASGTLAPERRRIACIVLKACHVINHIEARDLFHRLPLSEESFGEMAAARVLAVLDHMKNDGFPIQSVSSSSKSRASLVSKLLQKADTLAARIYDRTRFRVVVDKHADVLPLLHALTQTLFPFHLVVPGQTQNSLIDFRSVLANTPAWAPFAQRLQFGVDFLTDPLKTQSSEFSGSTYKILKFVVDMPLRIDQHLISTDIAKATRSRAVCCLVEFQIVDAATALSNEAGENAHTRYKERQRLLVQHRLSRGLAASFTRKADGDDSSE